MVNNLHYICWQLKVSGGENIILWIHGLNGHVVQKRHSEIFSADLDREITKNDDKVVE